MYFAEWTLSGGARRAASFAFRRGARIQASLKMAAKMV